MTETQPTLGEFLRQERERKGITIEQVASATKVSVRLLHLLESDQYVELPAKPFIRGFVMSYCRFIGIDPKEVLIRYGEFLEERSHDRPTRDEGHSGYAFEKREGEQSRTVLSIVMGAFVVLGAIAILVLKPSLHRHHNSRADRLREANPEVSQSVPGTTPESQSPSPNSLFQVIPGPSTLPSVLVFTPSPSPEVSSEGNKPTTAVPPLLRPVPKPKPSSSPAPRHSSRPVTIPSPSPSKAAGAEKSDLLNSGVNLKGSEIKYKIILKTSADIWVRYQDDDRTPMRFILRAGKVLVLRAAKEIRFQSSRPDVITFRVNNGPRRSMSHDPNVALRGKDLTLYFPKELAETIQDPFPGSRSLLDAFVPSHSGTQPHLLPSP